VALSISITSTAQLAVLLLRADKVTELASYSFIIFERSRAGYNCSKEEAVSDWAS
jgi:hypothetical protein